MKKDMRIEAEYFGANHRRKRVWYRIVSVLACVVMFCTTYAMILPAVTLDTSADTFCGIEQHIHNDSCYEFPAVPAHTEYLCGTMTATHVHTADCYDAEGKPVCGLADYVLHQHNSFCFDGNGELICTLPEKAGELHTHTEACYGAEGKLICNLLQVTAHQHTEDCLKFVEASEPQNLICTKPEHIHTEDCMNEATAALVVGNDGITEETESENPVKADDPNALKLSKQVKATSDGYLIKLETYVTGETQTVVTSDPVDIVLVLDVSGSMDYSMKSYQVTYSVTTSGTYYYNTGSSYQKASYCSTCGGWYTASHYHGYIITTTPGNRLSPKTSESGAGDQFYVSNSSSDTRLKSLKNAIAGDGGFIDKVAANSDKNRIAIVTFASSAKTVLSFTTVKGNEATIKSKINGLTANGGTYTNEGMEAAQALLNSNPAGNYESVVLFSDGVPGSNGFDSDVASEAIKIAKEIKDTGTMVYSVGIFEGAVEDELYGSALSPLGNLTALSETGAVGEGWKASNSDYSDPPAGNRFMNYISSNFKNATSCGLKDGYNGTRYNAYTITENFSRTATGFYMTASDATQLNAIFKEIPTKIKNVFYHLDDTAVLKDIVSQYFEMDIDNTQENKGVKVYTLSMTKSGWNTAPDIYSYGGKNTTVPEGVTVSVNESTKEVNVTGFDYAAHFVDVVNGTGQKLCVEIPITASAESGESVITNAPGSGIYVGGEMIGEGFVTPKVDVPAIINLTLELDEDAADTDYAFSAIGAEDGYVYETYNYTSVLTLNGTEKHDFTMKNGDTTKKTHRMYALDGNTVTITEKDLPAGYAVLVDGVEQTLSNHNATFSIVATGTKNIVITNRYVTKTDLTVKNVVLGEENPDASFSFRVQYQGKDGPVDRVFGLDNGGTEKLENIPVGAVVTLKSVSHDGYTTLFQDDKGNTLGQGDTFTYTITQSDYTIVAVQTPGVMLPSTGGSGTLIYTVCGLSLMTVAVAGCLLLRKKEKNNQ